MDFLLPMARINSETTTTWDYPTTDIKEFELCHEKTCPRGSQPGNSNRPAQLQRLARVFEILDLASAGIMVTIKAATNKGSDQYAQMHRLICVFVVRI